MQLSILAKHAWRVLFAAIAAFYFWGLGSLPLVGPDEPRYAQVAREMLERRDLITPTLGGLPWFEKPPLLYWMMMAGYRLFGVNEYAARLGPALCGLLTTVFVYWIGRAIGEETATNDRVNARSNGFAHATGRWSAFVWLSSLGVIVFSRGANFDIVLTMTVAGAFASFFAYDVRSRSGAARMRGSRQLAILLGFHFFTGASLLAKGLAGVVIIVVVLVAYHLVRRERPSRNFLMSFLWGLPLALAIAAVWYGPMLARHGYTFIDQFFIQHHFARFTTNKYHHPQPIYFYPLVLLGLVLPWTIALVAVLVSARRWKWGGESPLDRGRVFALAWLIVPLIFFSLSQSKLPAYILPALPAAAFLLGERIACFCREGRGERVLRLTGLLLIVSVAASFWYAHRYLTADLYCLILVATPSAIVGSVAAIRPKFPPALFMLIGVAVFVSSGLGIKCIAPVIASRESVRDLVAAANVRGFGAARIVQLHTIDRTIEFYAAQRVDYQSDGEPVKFEGARQVFEAARTKGGVVLCLVPPRYVPQLTTEPNIQTEVVADNGRVALVVVRVR